MTKSESDTAPAGGETHGASPFAYRMSVMTQTEVIKRERWEFFKLVWRNKSRILTCLCVVAALGWQLKEQVRERVWGLGFGVGGLGLRKEWSR